MEALRRALRWRLVVATVDAQIRSIGDNIASNIAALANDRGLLAQNLLAQLRNLVEAVAVRLHAGAGDVEFHYHLTKAAITWTGSQRKEISFLYRFHKLLQMSASHYTFEADASERLMLKYYEYLMRTKALLRERCGISIISNLDRIPVDLDPSLREYHEKIAKRIEASHLLAADRGQRDRYYVHKARPFFTDRQPYYEVTFSHISDRLNKFDRMIAFTDVDLREYYAANLTLVTDSISVLGQTMPITIIRTWEVSIRPCELNNFARILGSPITISSGSAEYRNLMTFLTDTSSNLLNLMDLDDAPYSQIRGDLTRGVSKPLIFPVLDTARQLIRTQSAGYNVLRYLLFQMNNRILKLQYDPNSCDSLSNLRLSWGCKPFDTMPFCTSARQHNPRLEHLAASLDVTGRTHELLARRVKNNVERHGMLYTPAEDLKDLGPVDDLVARYNGQLYSRHPGRTLIQDNDQVFLREYEDGTVAIIEKLQEYVHAGVAGYETAVERWLVETTLNIDDEVKRAALKKLFAESRVALIYGAAGTGKSTMVNYIANYFGDKKKLFLAHTNPAKDNLERKVAAQNTEFHTISSHVRRTGRRPDYDVLIIDECSTVDNANFLKILESTSFQLLVLVGDVYQIESIQFGNWFSIIRSFVPSESVFELTTPFRTNSASLLDFWAKVRHLKDGIDEVIAQNGYSTVLDESLFEAQCGDEIILCLNYDGLYGINNVNRFLQSRNPGKEAVWGAVTYRVGDPVIFNDVDRFRPLIYNNLKGRIVDIALQPDRVQFDVWLDRGVTDIDVQGMDLRYTGDSTVQFDVFRRHSTDDDDDRTQVVVPFQVAYAISIHKAQGLEYDSVKIVITEANEEDITHNIFYTAVTRARKRLKIFWTPETQQAVLKSLQPSTNPRDVGLLSTRRGLSRLRTTRSC